MRKLSYQFGTAYETTPVQDPWRRRMPTQMYIGPDPKRRPHKPAQPAVFGKRRQQPETVITTQRFSLTRLTRLFQGPRNTRRTNAR
jgi:hypothetical protein